MAEQEEKKTKKDGVRASKEARERDNARSPLALRSLCSFSLTVYVVWGTGLPRHPLSYSHSTEPFLQPLFLCSFR